MITRADRRARLAVQHRLSPGHSSRDALEAARSVVALHSTDPVSVYLSVWTRTRDQGPSTVLAAVDRALYEERSLVRHHAMRRTLWVADRATTRLAHAAATTTLIGPQRRLLEKFARESGIEDPARWLEAGREHVLAELAAGPTTARELGRRVPELARPLRIGAGTAHETTQGAHSRVLLLLGFEAEVVRARPVGTWVNGQYTWAGTGAWLGEAIAGLDPREAARDLALAYLRAFGPVTDTDVRWWAGWTVATARRALADAGAVAVETQDGPAWLAPEDPWLDGGPEVEPWVAVLPTLDPSTMGWKERDWYLPAGAAEAFDRVGNGGPTLWVDGRIVGAWAQRRDGEIRLHWFEDVPAARRREVAERAEEVAAFLGETRFTTRFAGTIGPRLLA